VGLRKARGLYPDPARAKEYLLVKANSFGHHTPQFGPTSGRARAIEPWRKQAQSAGRDYLFCDHDLDNIFDF